MRYAIVTETYPPEVNGVALTVQGLAHGLASRGHAVEVVRPRQPADRREDSDEGTLATLLLPGAALPRYPGLRFGLPATATLARHWREAPPDAVYIATEGPLGWSALRAAARLGIGDVVKRNHDTVNGDIFVSGILPQLINTGFHIFQRQFLLCDQILTGLEPQRAQFP